VRGRPAQALTGTGAPGGAFLRESDQPPVIREANTMSSILQRAAFATLLAASFSLASAEDVKVTLTGDQEVPPVTTSAKGVGKIKIGADKNVSGKITTTGVQATMAHIHEGKAPKENGPPIITLEKAADGSWVVPAGSKLTEEQYDAFKAGRLYVNIHSAEYKGGEIRAPLKP
jgi:CHRD domain